jgi:hypothetical protein
VISDQLDRQDGLQSESINVNNDEIAQNLNL